LSYKEQFDAVIKENTILKKGVAIQHARQKEHDERNQELQQLKQLVVQYREQIRSLEVQHFCCPAISFYRAYVER
jgi:cell division protein FtsB